MYNYTLVPSASRRSIVVESISVTHLAQDKLWATAFLVDLIKPSCNVVRACQPKEVILSY